MRSSNAPAAPLDAPIPGQSLTAPLGGRPWQRPPQFNTPEQALSFYVDRITNDRQASEMMDLLEMGVPVDTLVDNMTLGGVMEGLHSADVSMIVAPALMEVISGMAKQAGVKHTVVSTDVDEETPTNAEVAITVNKLKEKANMPIERMKEEPQEEEQPEQEAPRGLMARRA